MTEASRSEGSDRSEVTPGPDPSSPSGSAALRQLSRWGGVAGLAGVILFVGTVGVVTALGLPDASDPETLTDFADIESGRIAEHLLYLGALILFALLAFALHQLLRRAHPAAALFGTVTAAFGLGIMAASSLLHLSTSPLAELYEAADTSEDQQMVEYAWHGAQSVFDTMLVTGALLVPVGIVQFGVAMRAAPAFGSRLAAVTIGLGVVGIHGALIEIVYDDSDASADDILAIVVFNLSVGWRLLTLGRTEGVDRVLAGGG